jgi:curved DNA-binding protein CbpA
VTFYDLLDIAPGASQDQINKAYRKKSRQIHPDKARQSFVASYALKTPKPRSGEKKKVHVRKQPSKKEIDAYMKEATSRYQRLTVVVEILKGPSRERYDHFLKNGFPKWRGTGYYYARFRPGLGSVLLGLLIVGGGGVHYGALMLSWKRQREFVERYIRHARRTAWGDDSGIVGIPGVNGAAATPASQGWETPMNDSDPTDNMPMNRRQKRFQEKEARKGKNGKALKAAKASGISTPVEASLTSGPVGAKKRIVAENGKVLIVDSVGNVYVEGETEEGVVEEYLLDVSPFASPIPPTSSNAMNRSTRSPSQRSTIRCSSASPSSPSRRPSAASQGRRSWTTRSTTLGMKTRRRLHCRARQQRMRTRRLGNGR